MKRCILLSRALLAGFALCTVLSISAFAEGSHEHTQFGHDINIAAGEESGDITCFGCSVRIRGHVTGDVTVFAGGVVIEDQGRVNGDATVFGSGVRLDSGSQIGGDVTVFGGQVHRDASASIGGDITNFSGPAWLVLVFGLPFVILGAFVALIVWVVRRLTRPSVPVTA